MFPFLKIGILHIMVNIFCAPQKSVIEVLFELQEMVSLVKNKYTKMYLKYIYFYTTNTLTFVLNNT